MKSLVLTALCALTLNANAATYGVGTAYELDSATSNVGGLKTVAKASVLTGMRGKYGQVDAGLFEVTVRGKNFFDTQQGAEVGYGHGVQIDKVNLSGRVGWGKVYGRGLGAPSDEGTYQTYTATAAVSLSKQLAVSISGRYRPDRDFDQQQQYSLGASYFATKNLMFLGSYRHTRSTGPILNGASFGARYFF